MHGSGVRVPLRFSPSVKLRRTVQGAGGIGLFPGAIVALKGRNGGGGLFVVNEVLGVNMITIILSCSTLMSCCQLPPLPVSTEPSNHKAYG